MATGLEPRPPAGAETLAERAYRELEEMIVTLKLPPGSSLSDAELSQQLGIGRTPIREALQRLAAEHLVEIVARRAILVSRLGVEEQMLVLETRRDLERLVARRAARLATATEREQLRALGEEMAMAADEQDDVRFMRCDADLNEIVAACSRNPFAVRALAPLYALSRRFWFARHGQHDLAESASVHLELIEAIVAGDEDAAAAASDEVLDYATNFLLSSTP
jgi:DNA-binding GntR family transcriptional regulator